MSTRASSESATTNTTTTDLLIVGGGPAGLSAAIMFSRLNRPCVVYDSGLYRNEGVAHSHTIAGYENAPPADVRSKIRADLQEYYGHSAEYRKGKIVEVKRVEGENRFEAKDEEGRSINARKVVLATGLKDHLSEIPGLAEQWGKRAIHCIFCHGTETREQPFAFLVTEKNKAFNPMMISSIFKLWRPLNHTKSYIFTHGLDVEDPAGQGRKDAGLEKDYDLVRSLGYEIITSPVESVYENTDKTALDIKFTSHPPITIPYMLVFPEKMTPSAHSPWLAGLFSEPLGPMGTIPFPPAPPVSEGEAQAKGMPRMGDDPKTSVKGLFWAGNSGSAVANVAMSVAQGQMAAAMAGDELGEEDINKLRH
ncbi:hypothetical protein I316_05423 [Kwoniella heveanensis BCC8398]|uniref:FAD/NAD(P)-binding domain-containing protein n=1 Tax=Kwoniella heveanensis BCC8398 TaxID=1296120 RepID=A0A1B9GP36_9TREE|nr:hypothetical protein I316_05423 [Kwoniella heveanensis BCC8398]